MVVSGTGLSVCWSKLGEGGPEWMGVEVLLEDVVSDVLDELEHLPQE